ncbi:hypothetical protein ABFS82_08G239200 [Erythranthe guttata]|uniref:Phosphatidylinositol N-acetylglucosaminyltransferase subunit H conserved domain-containing protein n=1 Tax=Erythranthe guttata TaxID=4155 RepID=A0A022QXB2_ERYGU|nr:PREDICTED: phosphatidylinositol N-acetylglucosaminyltransferase subunit H [Erythranthe guttata]EYU31165.1 hypothetical protein MIMGU_mgv1a014397mg [Erythranthe guttata]|eukprot:XP_012845003.1 PREDICTED: phosphatidylinositol N-acetylglucosaminyltransferase subunit H [Erythranthe guttata]
MESSMISKGRYKYVHDVKMGPPEAIDIHHIIFESRGAVYLAFFRYALLFAIVALLLFQNTMSFPQLLTPDNPVSIVLWSFTFASLLVRQLLRKQVEKGTVIILPAFGIQLETSYRSGTTVRRFVPMGKILKPVLNECLTPVTCYWSLSLILRGEEELLLVFKELYPPVTMLVPIWKAVCGAINDEKRTPKQ